MPKFRKKPVVIEAVKFTPLSMEEVESFVGGDLGKNEKGETVIATLEGGNDMFCWLLDYNATWRISS